MKKILLSIIVLYVLQAYLGCAHLHPSRSEQKSPPATQREPIIANQSKITNPEKIPEQPATLTLPAQAQESNQQLQEPFIVTDDITPPVLEHRVAPVFPTDIIWKNLSEQREIIFQAVIKKDGTVGEIKMLRSSGTIKVLEEAAIEAIKQWRYKPALKEGKPVDVYFTIRILFDAL